MPQPSITLRPGSPETEEGLAFARYLDEAAEGFFRLLLGPRAATVLARAYVEPGNDYSFENVVFAERDGAIVGMASGYSSEQHQLAAGSALETAAGGFSFRTRAVALLFAPLLRVLDTVAEGDFYLQAIAIDRELRGAGVGSLLIDSIEERAVAGGSARLALDVSAGNDGARRLYERRGLTVESRWPKRLPIPGFKVLRMTKPL